MKQNIKTNKMSETTNENVVEKVFNVTSKEILKNTTKNKTKKNLSELVNDFINKNDTNVLTPLYNRYAYGLKKYAWNFFKDNTMADEMVLLSFEKAWENKDKFDPNKAQFSTWLYTICKNICLGEIYGTKKQNIINADLSEVYDSKIFGDDSHCETNSNYTIPNENFIINKDNEIEILTKDEIIQKFYDVSLGEINKLDERTNIILKEKLLNNKKIKEISEEQNLNMSTVKNILYKGKEDIKNILIEKHNDLYNMYLEAVGTTELFF